MAVRADFDLKNALIKSFTVGAGGVTVGRKVKFGATDLEVVAAGAGDVLAFGTAMATAAQNARVEVCLDGTVIVPVAVGTGGVTRGTRVKLVADGVTDITAGTDEVAGRAYQSGVVGDLVGMIVGGGK